MRLRTRVRVLCHRGAGDEWAANRSDGGEEMWVNGKDGDVSAKNLAEKEIWRSDFLRRKEIGKIGTVARSLEQPTGFVRIVGLRWCVDHQESNIYVRALVTE